MNAAVIDASVAVKWFHELDERHLEQARRLRTGYAAGALTAYAPTLLRLEVLNALARRLRFADGALASLAATLDELRFELLDPEIARIAPWVSRGLSAYDASYVALAEREAIPLVTDDDAIVRAAPGIAVALADAPV